MSGLGGWLEAAGRFGKGVVDGAVAGGKALARDAVELAKAGRDLATEPAARARAWDAARQMAAQARDYASQARQDPAKPLRDARDGVNRLYTAFDDARAAAAERGESAEFWGETVGRGGFEVGAAVVPAGIASKAGKLAKGAKAAAGVLDEAADVGRAGQRARAARIGTAVPDAEIGVNGCPRPAGAGPAGGAMAASAPVVARRQAVARGFYEQQGWEPGRIDSHLKGIDFTREVEVVELPANTPLAQWQVPGGPPGNYFAPLPETPGGLGISTVGDAVGASGAVSKVQTPVRSSRPVQALRSTAAAMEDTWSSRYGTGVTRGGGTQYFIPDKDAFGP